MSEPEASVVLAQAYLHTQMRLTVDADVALMGRSPESAFDRNNDSVGFLILNIAQFFFQEHLNTQMLFLFVHISVCSEVGSSHVGSFVFRMFSNDPLL